MDDIKTTIRGFLDLQNAENTKSAYGTALNKHFLAFLQEQGMEQDAPASALTADHAIRFAPYLRRKGLGTASLRLYLTAVYRFYRYLLKLGHEVTPGELARLQETYKDARQIRGQERPIQHKLEDEIKLIQAARDVEVNEGDVPRTLSKLRDVAIVECLRASGCRIGELVGLRLSDLGPQKQCALVKGKGSKYRQVYFDNLAWEALKAYLRARELTPGEDVPVFVGHAVNSDPDTAITARSVSRMIKRLGEIAEVEDITPHYFRHVFATRALEHTDNLAVVQDLLGHASPVTTRTYAKTNQGQLQAAHEKMWE